MSKRTGDGAQLELFVFPLPQVSLFPQTTKPLNIFEPRYVEMVNDALKDERLVALAYADPTGTAALESGVLSHVRKVAGYGRVELFQKRPDGTMIVFVHSEGKIELEEAMPTKKPYIVARGRKLEEATKLDPSHAFLLNRLMKRFRQRIEEHMTDVRERENFWEKMQTPEEKLNAYCAMMIEEPEKRQRLLEADGISDRLSLATLLLESESASSH